MRVASVSERLKLAQRLLSVKQSASLAISEEFFLIHPEWEARFGDRGRQFCAADACSHIEFLAGAIQAGSPESFADYSRWAISMLSARGIDAHSLEEHFALIEKHISLLVLPAERAAVSDFLGRGKQACAGTVPETTEEALTLSSQAFLAAILGGQRQGALRIVELALESGEGLADIYVDVIAESLHAVGRLWEKNLITVAQEHMATAIAQYVIAMIYPRLTPALPKRGNLIVTGVSGEQHQIGANLVADALEEKGWAVRFLGSNLPHPTILDTVHQNSADVLCISTTLVANLPAAADLIRVVRSGLGEKAPRIVLGGAAYRVAPQFAVDFESTEAVQDLRHGLRPLCP